MVELRLDDGQSFELGKYRGKKKINNTEIEYLFDKGILVSTLKL